MSNNIKKKSKTVLITSAGVATAINVISALRQSNHYNVKIIAVDMDENAAGLFLADKKYKTLPASHKNFISQIIEICKKEKVDYIFPLHSSEIKIFSKYQNSFMDQGYKLSIPELPIVNLCTNKKLFIQWLNTNSFDYPYTYLDKNEIEDFPVFIKPIEGSSSNNTFTIRDTEELHFYLERYPSSIIQEYITSREVTVDCYIDNHFSFIGCVPRYRHKVKDGKVVVSETFWDTKLVEVISSLLNKIKYRGACNVQLFWEKNKAKIIEINPRMSAGGLPLATKAGLNIPELMLMESDGIELERIESIEEGLTMVRYLTEVFISAKR